MSGFIDNENNCIITPSIKKLPEYKNLIAFLTRSDAHHDLGELFKDSTYKTDIKVRNAFDSALPVPASTSFHEGVALASSIISATSVDGTNIPVNGLEDSLKASLDAVPDCTSGDNIGAYSLFNVGTNGKTFFKYKVVKFVIACSTNTAADVANACKTDFGKKFVEYTKLGEDSNEVAIVVDFSQHHFIEKLASGAKSEFIIDYLMMPEVVNDPAGKPNVNNKTLFGLPDNGVRLRSFVQTDNDITSYTKFDENDPSTANNFFSKYDFTLSPIKQIFTKQKAEKLITTLNIKYDNGSAKPLTDTIEDSKGENSITTVLGYLKKILAKIRDSATANASINFNFNSKCQQKRGGDWFQGLSCLDARDRDFTQILPERGQSRKLNSTCPIYLVTHDRIAAAYALLNGVNVIYIDYYGRIFIFKNNGDKTLKGSGRSVEHILFDGIKAKWPEDSRDYNMLMTTATKYIEDRSRYLNEIEIQFNATCGRLNTTINDINLTGAKAQADYQRIVSESLKELFTSAVELMFIKINLIDITNDVKYVEANVSLLRPDSSYVDSSDFKDVINKFSKSINNIKGVQDRFGAIPKDSTITFYDAFKTWSSVNVKKLDVYRAANAVLDTGSATTSTTVLSRIASFFSRGTDATVVDERATDSHIFLPFIQNLEPSDKDKVIILLKSLTTKTDGYYKTILNSPSRPSRSGGISPNMIYYNRVANLIYESFLFLHNAAPLAETGVVDPIYSTTEKLILVSTSTDNILLATDKAELDIFKADGKHSNFTEDVEVPRRGGSSYVDTFAATDFGRANAASVICDVSVKQVIWPLLTSVLLENGDAASISKFVTHIQQYVPDVMPTSGESTLIERPQEYNEAVNALKPPSRGGSESSDIVTSDSTITVGDLANSLYEKYRDNSSSVSNTNLMLDFTLGFHPLVPIYAILTSYYNTLGNKYQGDPFFYTYFTYINVLEKMKATIEANYLNDVKNPYKTASAYLIGFGLNTMLIRSNTSLTQTNEILGVINMPQSDYYTFSLKNDSFAGLITGAIHQTVDEETQCVAFINNTLFRNFINNEVNIKQILELGTPADNLPGYEVLKDRIFNLMSEIVLKVNADRGTPIVQPDIAAGLQGISPIERAKKAQEGQQRYLAKQSISPIQKPEPTLKPFDPSRIVDASKLFENTTGSPENMVKSSTSSSSRSKGGKKSYRQKHHKKKTRKHRMSYKNKTLKRKTIKKNKKRKITRKGRGLI